MIRTALHEESNEHQLPERRQTLPSRADVRGRYREKKDQIVRDDTILPNTV